MGDGTQTVGLVGLGLLGSAMARRLIDQGRQVAGYDIAGERLAAARDGGVVACGSPAEVARAADLVLVCVTTTQAVGEVALGDSGVATAAHPGTLLVDLSTTETEATKTMAGELRDRSSAGWVDAPVSGGPPAAEQGRLAIMAGGAAEDVARARAALDALGGVTHMGPVGAGQATKLINQVLVLSNFAVLAEALRLGEKAGIDVAKVPDAVAGGYADSPMLRQFWPRLSDRAFEPPAGYARQVLKDLDMVGDLARAVKAPTPMADQARTLYRLLIARGYGELDAISVLKLYDEPPM